MCGCVGGGGEGVGGDIDSDVLKKIDNMIFLSIVRKIKLI